MIYALIRLGELFKDKISNIGLRKYSTCGSGTTFFSSTQILNSQKNKSKILVGTNSFIRGELFVFKHGGEIVIGNNCYIGEYSKIWSGGKITIGNNVLIAHNVNIHDNNSHPLDYIERRFHYSQIISNGHPPNILSLKDSFVKVEDDVWIGFNSIILKGVTIGKGAIIAAGTLITKDVPPFTVVAGNPAVVIKQLEKPEDDKNLG